MNRKPAKLVILELLASRTPPMSRAEIYTVVMQQWQREDGADLTGCSLANTLSALVTYGYIHMQLPQDCHPKDYSQRNRDLFTLLDKGRAFIEAPVFSPKIIYLARRAEADALKRGIPWEPYYSPFPRVNLEHARLAAQCQQAGVEVAV